VAVEGIDYAVSEIPVVNNLERLKGERVDTRHPRAQFGEMTPTGTFTFGLLALFVVQAWASISFEYQHVKKGNPSPFRFTIIYQT
jgi:hypothetical protein